MPGPIIEFIFPIVIITVFMYLILIRPAQKERAQQQDLLKNLKRNDKVATASGIVGSIARISSDAKTLTLRTGNSEIEIERAAVARKIDEKADKAEKADKSEKDKEKDK